MKVMFQHTQMQNENILYQVADFVPEEFESLDEAVNWINNWMLMKKKLIENLGIAPEHNGFVLRWTMLGVTFVEVFDVTV